MNFTIEEYKSRLKKVQASMQEKGIELLISQDPSNMNYLTGYDAWSFYYAQCVIVHIGHNKMTRHHILLDNSYSMGLVKLKAQYLFLALKLELFLI